MLPRSKFDQFLTETDSTLWPIPGQAMNNKSAAYKALPSIQALLKAPSDTDPENIIGSTPTFGTPLEHILEKFADTFQSIESMKSLFVHAKASPVYIGREKQQKQLDELIERCDRVEKFLYASVEQLNNLTLASFQPDDKIEG